MGKFIVFEGVEGCGKSYQSKVVHRKLLAGGFASLWTYEPGGTPLGNKVRIILKQKHQYNITPETELFLFSACRAQLVQNVIQPALKKGHVVVCDRFFASTVAYQGYGRGLDLDMIDSENRMSTGGLMPDLTILLDLPAEDGLKRKKSSENDRFEAEDIEFHRKVRSGYLKQAEQNLDRWMVIDARLPRKEISELVWGKVIALLNEI